MNDPKELRFLRAVIAMRSYHVTDWDDLLKALDEQTDALKDQCVSAMPDHLMQAQGRAQGVRDLVRKLREAPQIAERLKELGQW